MTEPIGRGPAGPLSVAELVALVRRGLEVTFADVLVEGEIRDLRRPSSGHLYFTLAGQGAQVRCVLFRSRSRLLAFEPADGRSVIARGQVTVYEPRGDLQLVLEHMEPTGIGALMLALEQLKARLAAEGLFAEERKRPIPEIPEAVGVVTSETGAAIRDILNVIEDRFPGLPVVLSPALVQGEGAAEDIARALDLLVEHAPEVEVIIVGRGGGSFEDLFPFNQEPVVRAVARCPIPVISAVGHEIDWTLCDLVADERAPTPTAAAQRVAADKAGLSDRIRDLRDSLAAAVEGRIEALQDRAESLAGRLADPRRTVERLGQRLDDLEARLSTASRARLSGFRMLAESLTSGLRRSSPDRRARSMEAAVSVSLERIARAARARLAGERERLGGLGARLRASSPAAVLGRGYALVRLPEGGIVRDASTLSIDDRVSVSLSKGSFTGRVESIDGSTKDGA